MYIPNNNKNNDSQFVRIIPSATKKSDTEIYEYVAKINFKSFKLIWF